MLTHPKPSKYAVKTTTKFYAEEASIAALAFLHFWQTKLPTSANQKV
jgi:hypothetical protein